MASTATAKRRARERRERREAILDAAAQVFGTKGATHATMEDVADAAEVSKGTLYLYFKSKDDLFVALTHRPLDSVLEAFEGLLAEPLDGAALLRRLLETHTEVVQRHAPHLRIGIASMCGQGFEPDPLTPSLEDYRDRVRTLRGTYIAAIERGMADGSIRDDLDPEEVAAGVWAAMFGANFLRMNAAHFAARMPEGPPVDFDRIVPTLADLLLAGLTPERRARS